MMTRRLIRNAVRCIKGDHILESHYGYDYKCCQHGVMVDGGLEYTRRGWPEGDPKDYYEELSEYADD